MNSPLSCADSLRRAQHISYIWQGYWEKGWLKVWSTTSLSFLAKGKQVRAPKETQLRRAHVLGGTAIHTKSAHRETQQARTRGTRRLHSKQAATFTAEQHRKNHLQCSTPVLGVPSGIGQASVLQGAVWARRCGCGLRASRHTTPGHAEGVWAQQPNAKYSLVWHILFLPKTCTSHAQPRSWVIPSV